MMQRGHFWAIYRIAHTSTMKKLTTTDLFPAALASSLFSQHLLLLTHHQKHMHFKLYIEKVT